MTNLFNEPEIVKSGAVFSRCRTWRYYLWRTWGDGPRVAFIGLNPSTADEKADDPTIRRCIGFAKDWGYDGLLMLNLFAFRSTKPEGLRGVADPIGPENDRTIRRVAELIAELIAAWGMNDFGGRGDYVSALLVPDGKLKCLGVTKDGYPRHPLYLPKAARRMSMREAATQTKGEA